MWKDTWIRDHEENYILGTLQNDVDDMKAGELIDSDTGKWIVDLVNFYFNPQVANQILIMPIHISVLGNSHHMESTS